MRHSKPSNGRERGTLKGVERHLSQRDMQVYWKREKLEEEYQQKCGEFIKNLELEKKRKWGKVEKTKNVFRNKSERKMKVQSAGHNDLVEWKEKRAMTKGLLTLTRDPKKFFKDVIGERKSIFAKNLDSVKSNLEREMKRKTLFLKKETRKFEKKGDIREDLVLNSNDNGRMGR